MDMEAGLQQKDLHHRFRVVAHIPLKSLKSCLRFPCHGDLITSANEQVYHATRFPCNLLNLAHCTGKTQYV